VLRLAWTGKNDSTHGIFEAGASNFGSGMATLIFRREFANHETEENGCVKKFRDKMTRAGKLFPCISLGNIDIFWHDICF
jgi:hypothetical protein